MDNSLIIKIIKSSNKRLYNELKDNSDVLLDKNVFIKIFILKKFKVVFEIF